MSLDLDFDPDELRKKYRQERDKRLRPEGDAQFQEVVGEFARYYDDDPFAKDVESQDPVSREVELLIIGGGFAGLMTAARLKDTGFSDICIIEAGSDFGGTWYWNRYPGAQCDIESYCYLPLLEETGYIPTEKYAFAPEIREHAARIARKYGLYEHACFTKRVTEMRWLETDGRWNVSTQQGDTFMARHVFMCTGFINRPKLPGIPGIRSFKGHSFHTSRWDYEYTGGDHTGGLNKLHDKRIAVIGTGATGIQCVPHLGASAEHLYVFQRTPSSVGPRGNAPTDPEWAKDLLPGWQRARQKNFNDVVTGQPFEEDLVHDGWTDIFRNLQSTVLPGVGFSLNGITASDAAYAAEIADFQKMNSIRERVDEIVDDRVTAEALKPWYRQFCKRPCFSDEYLPTFNRPNVTLVDTSDCGGVERVTETGIIANGIEYPVDCIVFATGFEVSSAYKRRVGFEVFGRDGRSLFDYWTNGRRTLHGYSTHGFPNWYWLGSSQNGLSINYSSMIEGQTEHLAYILSKAREQGMDVIEVTKEAEKAWVEEIHRLAANNQEFFEECTPGFYNNEGKVKDTTATFTGDGYAPGANAFFDLLAQWREDGTLAGLEFSKAGD